jgi:hypothetical protein
MLETIAVATSVLASIIGIFTTYKIKIGNKYRVFYIFLMVFMFVGVVSLYMWQKQISGFWFEGNEIKPVPNASLSGKDLEKVKWINVNLMSAQLTETNLKFASLYASNLSEANLSKANLQYADLSEANFTGANLEKSNLRFANLKRANLNGANLSGADLSGANLSDATGLTFEILSKAIVSPETKLPKGIDFVLHKKE